MAGHILRKEKAVMPVDYKGGEHSKLIESEFSSHHRYDPIFFFFSHFSHLKP